jgi:hypothetical protein
MTESAGLLKAEQPCDLRGLKIFCEIAHREIATQLIEDFPKA